MTLIQKSDLNFFLLFAHNVTTIVPLDPWTSNAKTLRSHGHGGKYQTVINYNLLFLHFLACFNNIFHFNTDTNINRKCLTD